MYVTVPITMQKKDVPRFYDDSEPRERKVNGHDATTVTERNEYLKVPVWLIVLLVGILISLVGSIGTTVYSIAMMRADINALQQTVSGQSQSSVENRMLRLEQKEDIDYKTNEERINDLRIKQAARGQR